MSFVVGAGLGREVLHDPLATAEGVLNWPIIMSQFTVIFAEVSLLDRKIRTSYISIYLAIPFNPILSHNKDQRPPSFKE